MIIIKQEAKRGILKNNKKALKHLYQFQRVITE